VTISLSGACPRAGRTAGAVLVAAVGLGSAGMPTSVANATAPAPVFINEIHYDNVGKDQNEGIEVAGPAGTELAGYSLELYNGYDDRLYGTIPLSGELPDQENGYGTRFVPVPGLQNGAPDGIALIGPAGVAETLGYEGSFVAADGSAAGLPFADIGRFEAPSTPVGESLQLRGVGTVAADFAWHAPSPATRGSINTGQTFSTSATQEEPAEEPGTPGEEVPPVEEPTPAEEETSSPGQETPPTQETASAPLNLSPPSITGAATVDEPLSCSTGAWSNQPTSYLYEWSRNGISIGAFSATYTAEATDAGNTLTCTVTANNATGASRATSATVTVFVRRSPIPLAAEVQVTPSEQTSVPQATLQAADSCPARGVLLVSVRRAGSRVRIVGAAQAGYAGDSVTITATGRYDHFEQALATATVAPDGTFEAMVPAPTTGSLDGLGYTATVAGFVSGPMKLDRMLQVGSLRRITGGVLARFHLASLTGSGRMITIVEEPGCGAPARQIRKPLGQAGWVTVLLPAHGPSGTLTYYRATARVGASRAYSILIPVAAQ
jgi:hypothetical protein